MDINRFTEKAQQALQSAQGTAVLPPAPRPVPSVGVEL